MLSVFELLGEQPSNKYSSLKCDNKRDKRIYDNKKKLLEAQKERDYQEGHLQEFNYHQFEVEIPARDFTEIYYEDFIKSKAFTSNVNMEWLLSYKAFLRDVGYMPQEGFGLIIKPKCLSWGKHTTIWVKK